MSKDHKKPVQPPKTFQSRLPMFFYQKGQKRQTYQNDKNGWSVAQRVQLRHAHQHKDEKPKPKETKPQREERGHSNHSNNTDRLSSISAKSSEPRVVVERKQAPRKVNVEFYLNKMPSQPYGQFVDVMLYKYFNNYQKLQRDHAFIQWIFPNSFQSRFNHHAKPLTHEQAEQFRTNPQIIKRYLKSYDMMLAFYGMKLKDKHTGELVRSRNPNYKERMYKTLVTSFHNHMRITRILTSLKETGFGRYASELCKFLKFQIYHPNGEMNMLKKYNVYKDWQPFERYVQEAQPLNQFLQKINKKHEYLHLDPNSHEKRASSNEKDSVKEERSKSLEKRPVVPQKKKQQEK